MSIVYTANLKRALITLWTGIVRPKPRHECHATAMRTRNLFNCVSNKFRLFVGDHDHIRTRLAWWINGVTLRVAPAPRSRLWCQSVCGFAEKKLDSLSDCAPPKSVWVCSWQQEATQALHANGITAKKKQTALALYVLAHALCSLTGRTAVNEVDPAQPDFAARSLLAVPVRCQTFPVYKLRVKYPK